MNRRRPTSRKTRTPRGYRRMARDPLPAVLTADVDWILFGGKGGVGKTTCAAATALYRVEHGTAPVRLFSTDPAHSLHDSLGAPANRPEGLTVHEFNAEAALEAFRGEHRATLHEIVAHGTLFDDEDIEQLLDLGLPGMDEVMAVLHLADRLEASTEETVILDTAPTGHTLRLLDAPEVFASWLGVLDAMLEKHRTMRATFGRADGPDALDRFLHDMEQRAERVLDTLRDPEQCQFAVVTQAEALVLAETERLVDDLARRRIPVAELIVNQCPWAAGRPHWSGTAVQALRAHDELMQERPVWGLPAYDEEVRSPGRLRRLWDDVGPVEAPDSPVAATGDDADEAPAVLRSVASPAEQRLLLFAGKGGVGKTTLACATALHRADRSPDASVLLLSTDPAHSLSTALQTDIGDTPTTVAPGLDALEIDAPARFEALRSDYVDEVRQFFRNTTGANVDLPYDRPVMEGLLDLAPPGVDEVMGWTAALEQLDEGGYDTCVLDTAPTGHFVRLLEMPRLFEEWLQAFFRILRKYRTVVRLPTLSDRLVRLSKQIKALRRMLEEDRTGVVYGVTLPTQMAWAETHDLLAAAARLDVAVPVLLLNRVDAQAADEIIPAFEREFPDRRHGVVTNGSPPRAATALRRLGHRLYD